MVSSQSTPTRAIVLHLAGASALFLAPRAHATPHLDALAHHAATGSLIPAYAPRTAVDEVVALLAMDTAPRAEWAHAFRAAFPDVTLQVITPCSDVHTAAQDLSLTSTLVCASSMGKPHVLANMALASPATITLLHLPMQSATDAAGYAAAVDALAAALSPEAHPEVLVTVVASFDQASMSRESVLATGEQLLAAEPALMALAPRQSHEMRDGAYLDPNQHMPLHTRPLPMTVAYAHTARVRADKPPAHFDVLDVYAHSTNQAVGTWDFLREVAFLVGAGAKYGS